MRNQYYINAKRYAVLTGADKCEETPISVKWRNHVRERTDAIWILWVKMLNQMKSFDTNSGSFQEHF